MIIVAGSPDEPPVELLLEEAALAGIHTLLLAEERASEWQLEVDVRGGRIHAHVVDNGERIDLSTATGLYLRLTAPTVTGRASDQMREARQATAVALLSGWADVAPMRVANRPVSMSSNGSKPYQTALIRELGFGVPETLLSNDPGEVLRFREQYGRVIYKSTSGVRSIVHELTDDRVVGLERIRALPTQFQRLVPGTNVRVHVVGDSVYACSVDSPTVDYRYAEGGQSASMEPTTLPGDIQQRCVELSRALDLPLAGVDLLHDDAGRWWCFEVNPSPAYSAFEIPTGLPIARGLARWLAGCEDTDHDPDT